MKRALPIPWIVLGVSLLLTAVATALVAESAWERDQERFANAVQSTRDRIEGRLETYVALLRGGAGLFAAAEGRVTREEFHEYASRLDVEERYPGIQGIGFSRRLTPENRDSVVAAMRAQGFPDFRVWADTPGVEPHAILYLEPLDARNRAAIGYNMFSQPTRRDAMERARDTGRPAMSGRVRLVQEIFGREQAGFLIYVPVYGGQDTPETVAARRALLRGFVYAPFRADDLFAGIFGTEARPRVAFRIYDGDRAETGHLLHDSRAAGVAPAADPDFTEAATLQVGGRTWTIVFAHTPFFTMASRRSFTLAVALAGLLMSLLLYALSRAQTRAQERIRASERRMRAVLEQLPVGVFVADRTGQITFSNEASRQIWAGVNHVGPERYSEYKGWRADTGKPITPEEWGLVRALQGESALGEVIDIEAFDGTRKTILNSAFPLLGPGDRVESAVAAVLDITEQRRAEAALRDRERDFRTMVDAIPQLAWMTDETGYIFWYNRRWYEYTGTTPEEMEGWGWQKVNHPEHVQRVTEHFKRAIEAGAFWEDTFPLRSKDGEYRWFLSRAVPIRDEEGRIVRWFGTNTDITEQKHAREAEARAIREQAAREAAEAREAQLRLQAVELERSNRELQDFAYVASHDLQEPLRKISTFSELLTDEYRDRLDEQATHYLERMQHAALRMSRLINDLLAFSRVQTRGLPFEPVDLNTILADVLSDLDVSRSESAGQVEVGEMPEIEADPLQLRQLFQNLIGNALKFRKPGTSPLVRVAGALEEADNPFGPGTWTVCRIRVEDNGIGFDEKYLDRIFAPFQRLHGKDEYEGTGIGLAICRRIVERHGGAITARSTPGKGATFIITLPIKQPRVARTDERMSD